MLRKLFIFLLTLGVVGVALALLAPKSVLRTVKVAYSAIAGTKSDYWHSTVRAPALIDPLDVRISASTSLGSLGDFDGVGCEGDVYKINLEEGQDAIISMADDIKVLEYPVWVTGGRNVQVVGLEMRPIIQQGCAAGEGHQKDSTELNIHPRIPGNKVFRFQQSGVTFVEGVDIDLVGIEADCFVSRNPDDMALEVALQERHVSIVNTRCVGIEGLDDSPIGDGIHGDFFQNQGRDDISSLTLENVTYLTSSNGITMHGWHANEGKSKLISLRNVNYGWDIRYSDDDEYEISGLAFTATADAAMFDNVWMNHGKGQNYGIVNGKRFGVEGSHPDVITHPGLKAGEPSNGDFAPADRTGLEYISPIITLD